MEASHGEVGISVEEAMASCRWEAMASCRREETLAMEATACGKLGGTLEVGEVALCKLGAYRLVVLLSVA